MQIAHKCTNCGSENIRVRTSEKMSMLAVEVLAYCNNCGTELKVQSQIVRVRTPTYHVRDDAMSTNKPLNQCDIRQINIPITTE